MIRPDLSELRGGRECGGVAPAFSTVLRTYVLAHVDADVLILTLFTLCTAYTLPLILHISSVE